MKPRVYLDHAATSFPKPPITLETMHSFSTDREAAVGRGAYRSSRQAGEVVARLRREIANWIGADSDQEISLHAGGTEALNTAIFGLLKAGDHVVTTAAEHNSVLRPLHHLATQGTISWTIVPVNACGQVSPDQILSAVTDQTRMVAVVHAANVNGTVQPIREIGQRIRAACDAESKPVLLCDAAQSFGQLSIAVNDDCLDLLAAPGHKGGCGPLGTGFLYVRKPVQTRLQPFLFGGTGTHSESLAMPRDYPTSFEAGNMNVPALAGWLAGLRWRRENSTVQQVQEASQQRLQSLAAELYNGLEQIPGVTIIGKPSQPVLPVASIAIGDLPVGDAAMILDSEFGIEVRSGMHCAALIHEAIGSPPDGTLRISCGESTTLQELQALFAALHEICGNANHPVS